MTFDTTSKLNTQWLTSSNKHEETNPYINKLRSFKKEYLNFPVLFKEELEQQKGKWKKHSFENILLEIGCHKGKILNELANNNKESLCIGLDITYKRVFLSAEKAVLKKLSNVKVALSEGKNIKNIFSPKDIDGIIVFFPDPWTKKANQQHNRLFNQSFCFMLENILNTKGFIWFKTDDKNYYDTVCHYMKYTNLLICNNKCKITNIEYKSVFEKRYEQKGIKIFEKVWRKH